MIRAESAGPPESAGPAESAEPHGSAERAESAGPPGSAGPPESAGRARPSASAPKAPRNPSHPQTPPTTPTGSTPPTPPSPQGAPPIPADRLAEIVARLRAAGCVFAEDEAAILTSDIRDIGDVRDMRELDERVMRRVAGEPLEQIVGWAEFCGLRIAVEPGVFVPRRRTGLLVREAVALLAGQTEGGATSVARPVVVDLCCGSGAVGVAVAHAVGRVDLHAADVEPAAVRCARRNLGALGRVYAGDLDAPLPASLRGRVAVMVVNAPYVPTAEIAFMPAEARDHEPRVTLDGGADGLDLHRRVAALAPGWLAPGGYLLVETSVRQAAGTSSAMVAHGLASRTVHDDDVDGTVVVGRFAGNSGTPGPAK